MSPGSSIPDLEDVRRAVSARRDWGLSCLRELISVDSVAPDERACQEALANLLHAEGLKADLVPLEWGHLRDTNGYVESGLPLEGRPNLVVTQGGEGGSGRSLILNSHIDTEPWREEQHKWRVHPLSGEMLDGKLYGRGSVDAKGQLMAAFTAVLALRDIGYEPSARLIVESVVDEEPGGNGTLSLCAQGWSADAALVLEPPENHVAFGHRGILGLGVTVKGKAGHGGAQGSGDNAVLSASRLAPILGESLRGWDGEGDAIYSPPTINVGRIEGGYSIFTVPDACTIEVGVRYAPGTYNQVLKHIRDHLVKNGIGADWSRHDGPHCEVFVHYDAAEVSSDSMLVTSLCECVRLVDRTRGATVSPACCDARHFVNRFGVPAVTFGPGQLSVCHSVDEYLAVEQWLRAVDILALFISRWCQ